MVGFQPDFRETSCELLPCLAALARGLQELKVAFGAIHHGVLAAEHWMSTQENEVMLVLEEDQTVWKIW